MYIYIYLRRACDIMLHREPGSNLSHNNIRKKDYFNTFINMIIIYLNSNI